MRCACRDGVLKLRPDRYKGKPLEDLKKSESDNLCIGPGTTGKCNFFGAPCEVRSLHLELHRKDLPGRGVEG